MKVCHKCRRELPYNTRILRSEQCPWCSADLHCCLNCRFHDPSAHNECHEVGTELIRYREQANYCGSFVFRDGVATYVSYDVSTGAHAPLDDIFEAAGVSTSK